MLIYLFWTKVQGGTLIILILYIHGYEQNNNTVNNIEERFYFNFIFIIV